MPASLNPPSPPVDRPSGERPVANGFAFPLQGPDDRHSAVGDRPGSRCLSCGWVTSAVSKTTGRIT
jgi:hypothetical protein